MIPWNTGQISWSAVNGTTNVLQLSTAKPDIWLGNLYWWRNMLPNEDIHSACKDWYSGTLSLPALALNVASVQAVEYSPNGQQVVQEAVIACTTSEFYFSQG